jgi:hypothetical protein
MPAAVRPKLIPGRVYRTEQLARYGKNPSRLAKRLVAEGKLRPLAHGMFIHPQETKFGAAPATSQALMRSYLKGGHFVFSGPEQWNALSLGATAMFGPELVYNERRTGKVTLGGRQFLLRRVAFPEHPTPEYFAIDLLKNHRMAGISMREIELAMSRAIRGGRLRRSELRSNASLYGTKRAVQVVDHAIAGAEAAA